ncbi:MAG: hypothetical protein SF123_26430 [Chloroflexota bacterium]|nr:hypothetical protein [Chloroflexota bacterium]
MRKTHSDQVRDLIKASAPHCVTGAQIAIYIGRADSTLHARDIEMMERLIRFNLVEKCQDGETLSYRYAG